MLHWSGISHVSETARVVKDAFPG